MTVQTVGIIGLGNMGAAMARSLMRAGFAVQGFDPAQVPVTLDNGVAVSLHPTPGDLCRDCEIIILSLPNASVVKDVVTGKQGLLAHAKDGLTIIDTTTSHPDTTLELAALLAEKGVAMIDAPVSGGPSGAESGKLGMVIGGSAEAISGVSPVLDAISAVRTHVGPVGAGHATKIINNALCAANIILAAEAVRLGCSFGLDPADLIAGLNSGSGRNAATEVNFPRWVLSESYDSGFTMKLMRKDVRLAEALMGTLDAPLPLLSEVARAWSASEAELADGEDFNRMAQLTLEK